MEEARNRDAVGQCISAPTVSGISSKPPLPPPSLRPWLCPPI